LKKTLLILLALLTFVGASAAQEAEDSSPHTRVTDLYLAKDDGSGKAGPAATDFVTTDVPIYCVVQLDSSTPVTVKMVLVAVNVAGVKPGTRVVATTYTTRNDQSRVNFTGRPDGNWVAGKYRVDVFVQNLPAGSRPFTVDRVPSTPKPASESVAAPVAKSPKNKKS
jgi:hypothetical protein